MGGGGGSSVNSANANSQGSYNLARSDGTEIGTIMLSDYTGQNVTIRLNEVDALLSLHTHTGKSDINKSNFYYEDFNCQGDAYVPLPDFLPNSYVGGISHLATEGFIVAVSPFNNKLVGVIEESITKNLRYNSISIEGGCSNTSEEFTYPRAGIAKFYPMPSYMAFGCNPVEGESSCAEHLYIKNSPLFFKK